MAASGAIRASGICFDVLVATDSDAPKRDAIQCRVEHSNGEALDVFMPYSKGPSGSFRYEEVYAMKFEGCTFPPPPPIASWHPQIGDPTVADSILDRLVHNAHRIELKGESMRKKRSGKTGGEKS
jgi:hypothetical protein